MKNKDDISAYTGIDNISNCQEIKLPTKWDKIKFKIKNPFLYRVKKDK